MATTGAGQKIVGYVYQFHRALYRLFSNTSPSSIIGIETQDDVVSLTRAPDGSVDIIYEQDKHSIQVAGHPYQDSSKNLWHTLDIWLDEVKKNVDPNARRQFCFVTNKDVPPSTFVRSMSNSNDDASIASCIKNLRTLAKGITGQVRPIAERVSSYTDEELAEVIRYISLLDEHGTYDGIAPMDAVIELFHLPPSLKSRGHEIYQSILGMLIEKCEGSWLKKESAWIDKAPFSARLHAEIQAHGMKKFIEQPWMSLDMSEYLSKEQSDHFFLRQMKGFGMPDNICNKAVGHYWGFYAERVRLIDEGDVPATDWIARDAELHDRWQQTLGNLELLKQDDESDLMFARKLFTVTLDGKHFVNLGNYQTSNWYFTAGNYHALANYKDGAHYIYWHSDFSKKIIE